MSAAIDPVDLAARLIACASVTPATGAVFDVLEEALTGIGFTVHRFTLGEAPDGPVENLFATRGTGAPHFAFAGHLDVVPPGEGWASDAFTPEIRGGLLHGRGAVDMKGGIAAFVAAAAETAHSGTLSLIITGDEEGPATYGTPRIMDWMAERKIRPDMILIGEPTSEERLGDIVKIGRRGSVNMWVTIPGVQGHVAYPHRADNPVPKLAKAIEALEALHLDDGNEAFQPSNLEITAVETSSRATNVIPGWARVQLNIRFNNLQRGPDLVDLVRRTAEAAAPGATVEAKISGEAFLTPPGPIYEIVSAAIEAETGAAPRLSTHGGTSDGRFLIALCPVVDFGLPNATMHKLDEAAAVEDVRALARIYKRAIAGRARRVTQDIYDPAYVKGVFDRCSGKYIAFSLVCSFGFTERWRRQCVAALPAPLPDAPAGYDLMAGTGEAWPHLLARFPRIAAITAVDISTGMHERAMTRLHTHRAHKIAFIEDDVLASDLASDSADFVISTFGLKTFDAAQHERLARLVARILKPGGTFSFIEASDPKGWWLRPLYLLHLKVVLPLVERLLLRGARDFAMIGTYSTNFGDASAFAALLRGAGLEVDYKRFFFGCATGVAGRKPL